jgi:hypothetical protein
MCSTYRRFKSGLAWNKVDGKLARKLPYRLLKLRM